MPPTLNSRIKALLFTTHLGGGGAEMQVLRLANHLDRDRFEVHVAVVRGGGAYEARLRDDVTLHVLGARKTLLAVPAFATLLRSASPDVVCSVLEGPTMVATASRRIAGVATPLVACVQAPPSLIYSGPPWSRLGIYRRLAMGALEHADRIVAISRGVADDLAKLSPRLPSRTEVIYNAGLDDDLPRLAAQPLPPEIPRPDGPLVVACGRLTAQKGYPYLLDAFARVVASTSATLWILGEGELRGDIESRSRRLGIGERVRLLGFQSNPFRFMAAADLFALSSIFEGFGNVIVEAMAAGAPVVATDCPHGPAEILGSEAGLLVPPRDPEALAGAILRVLGDPGLAGRLRARGRQRAQDFHIRRIAAEYADTLARVARCASATPPPA